MTASRAQHGLIGLSFLLSGATLIAATVWLLPATDADRTIACAIAASMAVAGLVGHAAGRSTDHPNNVLIYPLICFVALACLGSVTDGIATTYGGLLTMAFIYVGLYAPPGSTLPLILPAAGSWLLANGVLTQAPLRALVVRLPITLVIWTCIGVLLSRHAEMTRRTTTTLQHEARRDPLTGLMNRRALDDVLANATAGDAVVVIDLDHFKAINDEQGHAAGDQVLVNFARVMRRSLREHDVASRFGGDEFLLYLPDTTLDDVEVVLRRLRDQWGERDSAVTFSAGLAPVRVGRDGADAFGEADRLLYQAKTAGRSRWARQTVIPLQRDLRRDSLPPILGDPLAPTR